jgi:NAD+ synthase (glutamine-hydrolysing)
MRLVKVAGGTVNQTPLDWDQNLTNIVDAITEARKGGTQLLCLPELCICGYGCEDAFFSPSMQQTCLELLKDIAGHTEAMIVSVGLPISYQNGIFNTACLIADKKILGFVAKRFLAGDGIHYEPRWFKPWPKGHRGTFEWNGHAFPIGDHFFDVGGLKIGFEICEDAWVADRPGADLAANGVDLILNPSASHFAFSKLEIRKRFVLEGSRAYSVSYLHTNLLGNESGRTIYDGGTLIATAGKMVAQGSRFSFAPFQITTAVIDVDATRMNQTRTGSFEPNLKSDSAHCVRSPFSFPNINPETSQVVPSGWETSSQLKEEEFSRSVSLALFDYLRKSRSRGFVVSLSGGADSSAVASLVSLMVSFGIAQLGKLEFLKRIGTKTSGDLKPQEIVHSLLTCVYQSTKNSSQTTREAARTLAEGLGADFIQLEVSELVESYTSIVSAALHLKLTWQKDDLSLQNIQARVRSPGVWLIANVKGAILLSTSNRSEVAVGYATMDGDTSGGLSPLGGIDKAFIRSWLKWLEKTGPMGLKPIPTLKQVNALEPTAELRPPGDKQTDERDLMPYDVLDRIERCAIRDKLSPVETFKQLRSQTPHSPNELGLWIERFFRLWCRNQWKRERYAPSFQLDDENLDPRTWCRFPILSGGYDRELRELKAYIESSASE